MLNNLLERPEAQDPGSIILTGFEPDIVLNAIEATISHYSLPVTRHSLPDDYQISNTSWRVVKLILGNAGLSNKWWGVE